MVYVSLARCVCDQLPEPLTSVPWGSGPKLRTGATVGFIELSKTTATEKASTPASASDSHESFTATLWTTGPATGVLRSWK